MRLLRALCSTSARPSASMHRRHVVAEAAAQPLLEAVPAADRVVLRARPRLDGALGGRLLLVGAAERHPVAALAQHRVEVVEAAQVVAELGLADLHDQRRRVERLVAVGGELRATARRLQHPGLLARAVHSSVTYQLPSSRSIHASTSANTLRLLGLVVDLVEQAVVDLQRADAGRERGELARAAGVRERVLAAVDDEQRHGEPGRAREDRVDASSASRPKPSETMSCTSLSLR